MREFFAEEDVSQSRQPAFYAEFRRGTFFDDQLVIGGSGIVRQTMISDLNPTFGGITKHLQQQHIRKLATDALQVTSELSGLIHFWAK